jgi:hypothetical protein
VPTSKSPDMTFGSLALLMMSAKQDVYYQLPSSPAYADPVRSLDGQPKRNKPLRHRYGHRMCPTIHSLERRLLVFREIVPGNRHGEPPFLAFRRRL